MKFTKGKLTGVYYNFNIHNHILAIDINRPTFRLFYKNNGERDVIINTGLFSNIYYYIR